MIKVEEAGHGWKENSRGFKQQWLHNLLEILRTPVSHDILVTR